ncbi:MAG: hypothetical protein AAF433_07395 [Bacteroidota bacterium]
MYRSLLFLLLLVASCASDRREDIPDEVFNPPVLISTPDSEKELFVWDFSSPRTYVYEVANKTMTTISSAKETSFNLDLGMEMVQEVEVQTTGNHEAEFVTMSIEIKEISGMPGMESLLQNSMDDELPKSMGRIQADGTIVNEAAVGGMLFYLPERDLKPGERDTINSTISLIDSMDINLNMEQRKVISFVGYEEYEGRNCAVLVINELSEGGDLQVEAEDVEINAEINMASGSRYYFDVERHYFIGAEIITDGAMDDFDLSGLGGDSEEEMSMDVDVRTIQNIKLVAIKANE